MSDKVIKEKRREFQGDGGSGNKNLKYASVILLAGVFIAFIGMGSGGKEAARELPSSGNQVSGAASTPNQGSGEQASGEGQAGSDSIRIPLSEINDGKAHFYEYPHLGKTIRFFVLKSSDGVIRAAFDACDVCYREGKGYSQDGDDMVCNNCGKRFPSTRINEVKGGCNPAPLERKVVGDELVIRKDDVLPGARYF